MPVPQTPTSPASVTPTGCCPPFDPAVPGATMDSISGTFSTKVFEGPFRDAGKWAKEMAEHVSAKGRTLEKLYFGYTTCPACAKAYGKNYVVLFARVSESATGAPPSA